MMGKTMKRLAMTAVICTGLAAPVWAQDSCGVVVFFESGQTSASPQAIAALQTFVNNNPGATLTVTGYSDAPGSAAANLALSQRRA